MTGRQRSVRQPPAGAVLDELDEVECLRLLSTGGIGRIGFSGRFGQTVLPVTYALHAGTIVFRTEGGSPMDTDLRTGIAHADYQVAFEVDELHPDTREGWSVLVQGPVRPVESAAERAAVLRAGVDPWPGGRRDLVLRIVPRRVTGRRIRRTPSRPSGGQC